MGAQHTPGNVSFVLQMEFLQFFGRIEIPIEMTVQQKGAVSADAAALYALPRDLLLRRSNPCVRYFFPRKRNRRVEM